MNQNEEFYSAMFIKIKWFWLRSKIKTYNKNCKLAFTKKDIIFFEYIKKIVIRNDSTILSFYDNSKLIKNEKLNIKILIDSDKIVIFDGKCEQINESNNNAINIIISYINNSLGHKIFIEKRKISEKIDDNVNKLKKELKIESENA
jgi:hypothetical protein